MKWIPKIVYDTVTLSLSLPMDLWTPSSQGVGGARRFASGAGEAFRIRGDEFLQVRLRYFDSEELAVRQWLRWMQDRFGACQFYPDIAAVTSYGCDLHTPAMGEEVTPERDPQYRGAWAITLKLRSTTGTPFDLRSSSR